MRPVAQDVARAIADPKPSCGGKSIIELIWDELMEVYGRLMEHRSLLEAGDERAEQFHFVDDGGMARGLAIALALLINPYAPDVNAVRAEARQRWEESQ